MRGLVILLAAASAFAEVRVDNVLVKMVPPGTESLVGARMQELKSTGLFEKMLAARKLPELDKFAKETGFDPRTDVRELLFAAGPNGGVLLARGKFDVKVPQDKSLKLVRHGQYNVYQMVNGGADSGFCILDQTLAVAGTISVLEAALDEWVAGKHEAAAPLLAKVKAVNDKSQVWGISSGFASFVADHMPGMTSGNVDFSKIFHGVQDTWFSMDLSKGLKCEIHGTAANDKDATSLRDAAKGLIGFGRLSVPEGQKELYRVWDGIEAEQQGRSISIKADIEQDLLDKVVNLMQSMPTRPKKATGKAL